MTNYLNAVAKKKVLKLIFDVVAVGAGRAKSLLYTLIKLSIQQNATIVVARMRAQLQLI